MSYDSISLADLLLGPLRQRVLSRLLLHPGTSLHVRELARQTGTQPGTLNRELAKLAQHRPDLA